MGGWRVRERRLSTGSKGVPEGGDEKALGVETGTLKVVISRSAQLRVIYNGDRDAMR